MYNLQRIYKQPSILRFRDTEMGFTIDGFEIDWGLEYDYEFGDESPTIPIYANIKGMSPILTTTLLQIDPDTLATAFGAYYDSGTIEFPAGIIAGKSIYTDQAFTGELIIEPRVSKQGYYLEAERVLPQIVGPQSLSVRNLMTLDIAFIFLWNDSFDKVLKMEHRT